LPQKPKKRGHQAPDSDEPAAVDVGEARQTPISTPAATTSAADRPPVPANQVNAAAGIDKGLAKTIYSDRRIDDFLHQVRVEATVARLDLTHSAVWRLAMHEFMERRRPTDVVAHFAQAASKNGQVGRPKR
jgi:transcription termination factor NusB